jgi:hypothetical protein
MIECRCRQDLTLFESVTDPDLRDLLVLSVDAVRERISADRANGRARRADLLLGAGAGLRDRAQQEALDESATRLFSQARQILARSADALDTDRRTRLDTFLADGGLRRYARAAQATGLVILADSDCSMSDARQAAERLGAELRVIEEIQSTDDVVRYLDQRLDQLTAGPNLALRDANDISLLCFILLFFSSLYWYLLMVALYVCSALHCDAGAYFQQLLRQACG